MADFFCRAEATLFLPTGHTDIGLFKGARRTVVHTEALRKLEACLAHSALFIIRAGSTVGATRHTLRDLVFEGFFRALVHTLGLREAKGCLASKTVSAIETGGTVERAGCTTIGFFEMIGGTLIHTGLV
jgi:hypothetical protein